jgi:hypothetical protein
MSLVTHEQFQKARGRAPKAGLWLWLTIILLAGVSPALGQETRATLGGKVFDPQGLVVPGATVVVTSEETGVRQTTTTNDEGNWQVPLLLPGNYRFDVQAAGFKLSQRSVELQVGDKKFIDTTLEVGAVSETVQVAAAPPDRHHRGRVGDGSLE